MANMRKHLENMDNKNYFILIITLMMYWHLKITAKYFLLAQFYNFLFHVMQRKLVFHIMKFIK